jgi:uncharacterized protein with GYD domain
VVGKIKEEMLMGNYVVFFGYTDQGIRNIKDSSGRVQVAKKIFQDSGAKVNSFYSLMGMERYDTMFLVEAPSDESIAKASLKVSSLGNVRSDSHRIFTEDEFHKIVANL